MSIDRIEDNGGKMQIYCKTLKSTAITRTTEFSLIVQLSKNL